MLLTTHQVTENTIGGGPIGWVCGYVDQELVSFGDAITTIEVTVRSNPEMPGTRPSRKGTSGILSSQIPQPKSHQSVTFRRTDKKLSIHWMTHHLSETEMENRSGKGATKDIFIRAAQDVAEALDWGLHQRVKPTDEFDITGFLAWFDAARKVNEPDDAAFDHVLSNRSEQHRKRCITIDFHAKIKTDWAALHEDAAYRLGHKNLWDETDPRMPQGNPLGKGILTHFDYYAPMKLADVLQSFGLKSYEDATSDSDKIKALQIELGLVVAHIKKRGTVGADMVDGLISRMKIEAKRDNSFWVHRSKYGTSSHFAWMRHYLDHFASDQ